MSPSTHGTFCCWPSSQACGAMRLRAFGGSTLTCLAGRCTSPGSKNGDPLDLPLSDFLVELLQARRTSTGKSPWVFPSKGKTGHLVETKKFTARVTERSGVAFTLHDLRRYFHYHRREPGHPALRTEAAVKPSAVGGRHGGIYREQHRAVAWAGGCCSGQNFAFSCTTLHGIGSSTNCGLII